MATDEEIGMMILGLAAPNASAVKGDDASIGVAVLGSLGIGVPRRPTDPSKIVTLKELERLLSLAPDEKLVRKIYLHDALDTEPPSRPLISPRAIKELERTTAKQIRKTKKALRKAR